MVAYACRERITRIRMRYYKFATSCTSPAAPHRDTHARSHHAPCRAAPLHTRRVTPCTLTRRTVTPRRVTPCTLTRLAAAHRRAAPYLACCHVTPHYTSAAPRTPSPTTHLCRALHTEPNHAPLPRPAHRVQPCTFAAPRRAAHSRYITRPRDVLRLASAFAVRRSTHIAMPRRTTPRPLAHITLATSHLPPCVYPPHRPRYFSPPALRIPIASPSRTLCLVSSYRAAPHRHTYRTTHARSNHTPLPHHSVLRQAGQSW
ncbi:hypothetical protein IJ21_38140 [Paenibacillus sp. 32O-W]|nr:hypothetical protein IJ21_38140 [Paenibacillus sp. 32O-W]